MKYAIIILIFIIFIFILTIFYLKKLNMRNPAQNEEKNIQNEIEENRNPATKTTLIEYKKYQINIYHSQVGDILAFKKETKNRIKVLNKSKCIGIIPAKEVRKIELLEKFPHYYEGKIIEFENVELMTDKVCITLQIKEECSKEVYNLNHNYLNNLISIHCLFEKDQIISTNYGPSTVLEVHDNYLIVDVPSLGKREIYNINEIELN